MAVLLVDVGNSGWKYALLGGASEPVSNVNYLPDDRAISVLSGIVPEQLDAIAVSCVGGHTPIDELTAFAQSRAVPSIKVAKVENHWDGFQLGYDDVSHLGVDRWLAMLALREQLRALSPNATALLADCGTAVTVECITFSQHIGGLIAPGLRLMSSALNRDTADLPAVGLNVSASRHWEHGTEKSIALGCQASVLGLLKRQYVLTDAVALAVITGGDAELLLPELPEWQWQPYLVMEGLRLWACQAG